MGLQLPMCVVGVCVGGGWFQSLVGELGSCMPCSQKSKTWNRGSVVKNLIKTLKEWSTSKKSKKKRKRNQYQQFNSILLKFTSTKTLECSLTWKDVISYDEVTMDQGVT